MEVLAVISGVAIAVAGWFVTQRQARRAVRRNMRIDYLLEAYRRLDRASNREMTPAAEREIESAVADIQLLGSPSQVNLAVEFARSFATTGTGDTEPLLRDLRRSLRRELLLEDLPPGLVWLRISRTGSAAWDSSGVWQRTEAGARQALEEELGRRGLADGFGDEFIAEMRVVAEEKSTGAAVEQSAIRVRDRLLELTAPRADDDLTGLSLPQLAARALALGVVDPQLADSVSGLLDAALVEDPFLSRRH